MAKINAISWVAFSFLAFLCLSKAAEPSYNVLKYGAKPDGKTDTTQAFLKAWAAACAYSGQSAKIHVPKGRYLLKEVTFRGPCRSRITVQIDGTLVAPTDYRALGNSGYWILFILVNRLSVIGGTLDAKGDGFGECRKSGKTCPEGARECLK